MGAVDVYVMSGEVLAAHAADDDLQLLACLRAGELLPAEALDALAEASNEPGQFADALYDQLHEDVVQELMGERFRENLFRFLSASRGVDFEAMDAIFVSNIQIGHDSGALLEELTALRDRSRPIHTSTLGLLPGDGMALGASQARLVELCQNGLSVPELLRRAGREPNRVLHDIADLLDGGGLVWDTPPVVARPAPTPAPAATAPSAFPELPLEDDHTDERPQEATAPPAPAAPTATTVEDDAYLDAFGDYDTTRGDGIFSGVRDVVDLEGTKSDGWHDEPEKIPETLELPEADAAASATAVSLNFSGPRLADDDARGKIEVVNEVLDAVRAALDAAEGGSGQARMQLLVEGSSGPFAALFNGVELKADGRLPVEQVLKNLRKRPATEHRRLLQRAATDLIERALSLASEDLDDDLMESVLEKVAGYQKRLGI